MRSLVMDYTFNPTNKTITLSEPIRHESLLVITNVTKGQVIYNFAEPLLGGVINGNVITLTANTTSMASNDALQIFVDDSTDFEELAQNINDGLIEIVRVLQASKKAQGIPDVSGRIRANVETGYLGSIGTINNVSLSGGYYLQNMTMTLTNQGAQNLRNRIGVS